MVYFKENYLKKEEIKQLSNYLTYIMCVCVGRSVGPAPGVFERSYRHRTGVAETPGRYVPAVTG